ncbi:MaoC/PaaZ C-terminal domain-containing protein [Pseudomonas sp. BF-R-19]|uniref:MaoC/PaaZ C-terminal domain-containing protein n=1 Tax=Pseudomonas sp. BF-R-19 TaxID=2832397 RepID=UPI001CBC8C4A|nr:MaoC/PaaZ C-terminal domain-containing protein [Pseudomonas sp. BF-R-19]
MIRLKRFDAVRFQAGDSFTASRRYNIEDVQLFARLSRDYQLVHFDACYAEAGPLKAAVSQELLMASLVTEISRKIGWMSAGITYTVTKPVHSGDTITCHWVITTLDEQGRATAQITMTNEAGITVMDAETSGVVSGLVGHNNKQGLPAQI